MYCRRCGAHIPDGEEFCAACGEPSGQRETRREIHTSQTYHNNNSGIIIGIIIAVSVVLVAIIVCFTVLSKGQQDAQLAQVQSQQAQAEADKAASEQAQAEAAAQQAQAEADKEKAKADKEKAKAKQQKQKAEDAATINNYYYYGTHNRTDDYYSNVTSSGYLWPTDTEYISSYDLDGLGKDTVAAIRNEIYARHGYAFTTSHWKNYFSDKSWYYRDENVNESTINSYLSSLEKTNIDTIVKYERSMGWR